MQIANDVATIARNGIDYINELERKVEFMRQEYAALNLLVQKTHTAKGRYHSQHAMCDLYESVGLPCVRPVKDTKNG